MIGLLFDLVYEIKLLFGNGCWVSFGKKKNQQQKILNFEKRNLKLTLYCFHWGENNY